MNISRIKEHFENSIVLSVDRIAFNIFSINLIPDMPSVDNNDSKVATLKREVGRKFIFADGTSFALFKNGELLSTSRAASMSEKYNQLIEDSFEDMIGKIISHIEINNYLDVDLYVADIYIIRVFALAQNIEFTYDSILYNSFLSFKSDKGIYEIYTNSIVCKSKT